MPRKRKPAPTPIDRQSLELWEAVCALEGEAFAAELQRTADERALTAIFTAFADALGKAGMRITVPGRRGALPVALAVPAIVNGELLKVVALTRSQAPAVRALRAQARSRAKEAGRAERMIRKAWRAAWGRQTTVEPTQRPRERRHN